LTTEFGGESKGNGDDGKGDDDDDDDEQPLSGPVGGGLVSENQKCFIFQRVNSAAFHGSSRNNYINIIYIYIYTFKTFPFFPHQVRPSTSTWAFVLSGAASLLAASAIGRYARRNFTPGTNGGGR